ncbi:MAG: FtsX-like permease family protein [Chryseobacterium sp.]|nr:MAG: FtsX-like permease family protein [Chryseobacterium sp.]
MKIIDIETWKRKEHFQFFSGMKSSYFGIVTEVDCTETFQLAKDNKESFFAHYLHKSMKAVNSVEEFGYRIVNDEVIAFDVVHVGSTIGRNDGTFGFAYFEYSDDFQTFNMAEMIKQSESFTQIFTFLLSGIAGISLIVGGIGIMNIMLVTVTERTKEIGIRKAIGAKEKDILSQFLIESVVMTTSGGILGIVFGFGISKLIGAFTPFPPIVTISSIVVSISFSTAVGVFFGYYPARRAAKLDPIEALRYE